MSEEKKPINPINGAIILCDNVYKTDNGKYLISGTYTQIHTFNQTVDVSLNAYIRVAVEKAGTYNLKVKLIDVVESPTKPAIMDMDGIITVDDPLKVIEMGIHTPGFRLTCPIDLDELDENQGVRMCFKLWLEINGTALASSPFEVLFKKPVKEQS